MNILCSLLKTVCLLHQRLILQGIMLIISFIICKEITIARMNLEKIKILPSDNNEKKYQQISYYFYALKANNQKTLFSFVFFL